MKARAKTPKQQQAPEESLDRPSSRSAAAVAIAPVPVRREPPRASGMHLVEDSARDGQLTKAEFLARAREAIEAGVADELAGSGWSVNGCPWIEYWFDYYAQRSAAEIEASLRRYAPGTANAPSGDAYVGFLVERVRLAVRHWRATAEVDGPTATDKVARPDDPRAVAASLGPGQPLPSAIQTRMERGLGGSLAGVQIHTSGAAADVAQDHDARAITVGAHVAFANREYRPGSLVGDLLLAHELAHTLQQGSADFAARGGVGRDEAAADLAAVAAVSRMRGLDGAPPALERSRGLALRRCGGYDPRDKANPSTSDVQDKVPPARPLAPGQSPISIPSIPSKWLKATDDDHYILITYGRQHLLLPAKNLAWELDSPRMSSFRGS